MKTINKHFTQRPYKKIKAQQDYPFLASSLLFLILVALMFLISQRLLDNTKQIESLINETKEIRVEQQEVKEVILSEGDIKEARITCYEATGNLTASGKVPKNGMVATSDRTIAFGTKVIINGQTYSVEDRTAQWVQDEKGFTIDIFMESGCDANFGADKKLIIIK